MSDRGKQNRAAVGPDVKPDIRPGIGPNTGEDVSEDDLIGVARIARPQGHRGEVIADLLTDFPERFARLDRVYVKRADGRLLLLDLENSRRHKGRVALKFAGCDSVSGAEELRDSRVLVPRDQLVELPADTYYDFDLIGCEAVSVEGHYLGRVEGVQNYGAAPLLVGRDGGRELLIPLVLSICVEISTERKRIVVNPPEGLLDL
ncbi:MAG TPA: ribosome maturation factor RimM [Blastocatellia bacterium]|nr:ribosome maturation factor RimM [Blastocatellia bacterium]